MCLVTYFKNSSIAKEDITCYKIYVERQGMMLSPYQPAFMPKINITVYVLNFCDSYSLIGNIERVETKGLPPLYGVDFGFHSFFLKEDAESFASELFKAKVYKCIIPKGSKYYYGSFANKGSYCSNQIKVIEEIKI